jgi:hypothetical protein
LVLASAEEPRHPGSPTEEVVDIVEAVHQEPDIKALAAEVLKF